VGKHFWAALAQVPRLAERLQAGQRAARVAGTGNLPNFFRTPYGPGWALVGDAGYHRDPLTAQGISVIAGTVPVPEFFAPDNIQRIIMGGRHNRNGDPHPSLRRPSASASD
jgi:hypothetical protein